MNTIVESVVKSLNILSEGTDSSKMRAVAKNAIHKAAECHPGTQEYHSWMGVHHTAASHVAKSSGDKEGAKFHNKHAEDHTDQVKDEKYHYGDTKHWDGY
jgi:hypothetical protein